MIIVDYTITSPLKSYNGVRTFTNENKCLAFLVRLRKIKLQLAFRCAGLPLQRTHTWSQRIQGRKKWKKAEMNKYKLTVSISHYKQT